MAEWPLIELLLLHYFAYSDLLKLNAEKHYWFFFLFFVQKPWWNHIVIYIGLKKTQPYSFHFFIFYLLQPIYEKLVESEHF